MKFLLYFLDTGKLIKIRVSNDGKVEKNRKTIPRKNESLAMLHGQMTVAYWLMLNEKIQEKSVMKISWDQRIRYKGNLSRFVGYKS